MINFINILSWSIIENWKSNYVIIEDAIKDLKVEDTDEEKAQLNRRVEYGRANGNSG